MTKKQKKEIARMWMASLIQCCGTDSFELDEDCNMDDASEIIEECNKLGESMLGNRPFLHTLPMIIGWVIANK